MVAIEVIIFIMIPIAVSPAVQTAITRIYLLAFVNIVQQVVLLALVQPILNAPLAGQIQIMPATLIIK